jgi:YfiH family protein
VTHQANVWLNHPMLQIPRLVHGVGTISSTSWREDGEDARAVVAQRIAALGGVFWLHQVHGTAMAMAPWDGRPDADGALVSRPGEVVAVQTADCVPLLMCDPEAHLAAAVHAGWRGTARQIAAHAVTALVGHGADPCRLRVLLGPAIGVCCYAVGRDLREQFPPETSEYFVGPHPHLDLRGVNVAQLVAAGVEPDHIAHLDECTACGPNGYPSYRRDGRGCGRLFSYVGWEG